MWLRMAHLWRWSRKGQTEAYIPQAKNITPHTHTTHPFSFSEQEGRDDSSSQTLSDMSDLLESFYWSFVPTQHHSADRCKNKRSKTCNKEMTQPFYPGLVSPHQSLWSTCRSRQKTTGWWCHTPAGSPEKRCVYRCSEETLVWNKRGRGGESYLSPTRIRPEDGAEPPLSWRVPEKGGHKEQSADIWSLATKTKTKTGTQCVVSVDKTLIWKVPSVKQLSLNICMLVR